MSMCNGQSDFDLPCANALLWNKKNAVRDERRPDDVGIPKPYQSSAPADSRPD